MASQEFQTVTLDFFPRGVCVLNYQFVVCSMHTLLSLFKQLEREDLVVAEFIN